MSFLQSYISTINLEPFYNVETLTGSGVITLDLSSSFNFSIPMTASGFLANPTGASVGRSGVIMLLQNDAGDADISYDTYYKWPVGVSTSMTAVSGAVDVIAYFVRSPSSIICQFIADVG